MEIDKGRLKVIGKLIGIYRDELRDNSQNEYTMKKFCEDICSVNTLKTIESGGLGRSDEVYVALLNKLDLKLGYFPVIDDSISKFMVELYLAIEFFDIKNIDRITLNALRLLGKVKDYVYYSELYLILIDSRKNYIDATMIHSSRYSRYTDIIAVLNGQFTDLIILLMFNWIRRECMNNVAICKNFVELYRVRENKLISIRQIMLFYYNISSQFIQMKSLVDELEKELVKNDNKLKLLDIYNYGIIMRSYIDSENIIKYISKLEELSSSIELSKVKKRELYSSIGNSLHNMKEYDSALKYYVKSIELGDNCLLIDLVYMADCQNRLGHKIEIPVLDNDQYSDQPLDLQKMYNYFLNIEIPNFAKENYILKEIAPALKDEGFNRVFRFEIDKLVESTGHYKLLYSFEKILEENLTKSN